MAFINVYKGYLDLETVLMATDKTQKQLSRELGMSLYGFGKRMSTKKVSDNEAQVAVSRLNKVLVKRELGWVEHEINQ